MGYDNFEFRPQPVLTDGRRMGVVRRDFRRIIVICLP